MWLSILTRDYSPILYVTNFIGTPECFKLVFVFFSQLVDVYMFCFKIKNINVPDVVIFILSKIQLSISFTFTVYYFDFLKSCLIGIPGKNSKIGILPSSPMMEIVMTC